MQVFSLGQIKKISCFAPQSVLKSQQISNSQRTSTVPLNTNMSNMDLTDMLKSYFQYLLLFFLILLNDAAMNN